MTTHTEQERLDQRSIDTVVFDLGGVLIDWNPRYLYRKIFGTDTEKMEAFLATVCNTQWNEFQDRGRPWEEAITEATTQHPEHQANIRAYYDRWPEMLGEAISGTVRILEELRASGVRLLALTNWSAETFHYATDRYSFLEHFEGILVSGRERLMKPEPEIFQLLTRRYHLTPERTAFIDDSQRNVDAAKQLGFESLLFRTPDELRDALRTLRIGSPTDH